MQCRGTSENYIHPEKFYYVLLQGSVAVLEVVVVLEQELVMSAWIRKLLVMRLLIMGLGIR